MSLVFQVSRNLKVGGKINLNIFVSCIVSFPSEFGSLIIFSNIWSHFFFIGMLQPPGVEVKIVVCQFCSLENFEKLATHDNSVF